VRTNLSITTLRCEQLTKAWLPHVAFRPHLELSAIASCSKPGSRSAEAVSRSPITCLTNQTTARYFALHPVTMYVFKSVHTPSPQGAGRSQLRNRSDIENAFGFRHASAAYYLSGYDVWLLGRL